MRHDPEGMRGRHPGAVLLISSHSPPAPLGGVLRFWDQSPERGGFPLELTTRYDGVEEYALYRIPYQDGEYRFTVVFGN